MALRFSVQALELRTRDPFVIARGGGEVWPTVVVELEEDGERGFGEGAPRAYYRETAAGTAAALEGWLAGRDSVLGTDPADLAVLPSRAARAALDIALHDLLARRAGQRLDGFLQERYGLTYGALPLSSFTIGLDTTQRMVEKARTVADWPILKVKLGTERDLEILAALRTATRAELRVDANAAWTVEETLAKAPRLAELGVTLLEQPLPPGDPSQYQRLRGRLPLPVFVDESCVVLGDLETLAGSVDGINIKLGKCGGLYATAQMIGRARERGLGVMLGCFVETSISITAAACLGGAADYLDLDGAALLERDPYRGAEIALGRVRLPAAPGLGVAVR